MLQTNYAKSENNVIRHLSQTDDFPAFSLSSKRLILPQEVFITNSSYPVISLLKAAKTLSISEDEIL